MTGYFAVEKNRERTDKRVDQISMLIVLRTKWPRCDSLIFQISRFWRNTTNGEK